jgi:4-amino-4-deoxy-L-arabinose transferase-like glycosyltransferase
LAIFNGDKTKMTKEKYRTVFILGLNLLVQFVLRIPFLEEPLEGDEGVYAYIGQGLLRGEGPYRGSFDHKPPGIYFIYAGIFKIFGPSLPALRRFTLFYTFLTTFLLFWVGFLLLGKTGALLSAMLFALFSSGPFLEGTSSNTEVFMNLPLLLALLCFLLAEKSESPIRIDIFYFLTGLFLGLATMIKQVAFLNFLAVAAFLFFSFWLSKESKQRKALAFLYLSLGFLIFPFLFAAYFLAKGAFWDFVAKGFWVNFSYLKPFWGPIHITWARLNSYRIFYLILEESPLLLFSVPAAIYILFRDRRPFLLLSICWAGAIAAGIFSSRYLFGHYFVPLLPMLSIFSAYFILKIQEGIFPEQVKRLFVGSAIILGLIAILVFHKFYLIYTPDQISFARYHLDNLTMAREVAEIIKKRTTPEDKVLVLGESPMINFYAQRKSPARYLYPPFHFPKLFEEAGREAQKIIKEKKAKYIILTRPVHHELFSLLEKGYKLVGVKEGRYHGKIIKWGIFERKGTGITP